MSKETELEIEIHVTANGYLAVPLDASRSLGSRVAVSFSFDSFEPLVEFLRAHLVDNTKEPT